MNSVALQMVESCTNFIKDLHTHTINNHINHNMSKFEINCGYYIMFMWNNYVLLPEPHSYLYKFLFL